MSPSGGAAGKHDGCSDRCYSASNTDVGTKDGRVWHLVPAVNDDISDLGLMADWLAVAQTAGY